MGMIDHDSNLISPVVKAAIIANTPMTATKANIGALAPSIIVLLAYIIGRATGWISVPDASTLSDAVMSLISFVVTYAISWVSIYLPSNTPKLHPLALFLAVLGAVVLLAGCAGTQTGQTAAQRSASAMQLGLGVAGGLVNLYAAQPACGTPGAAYVVVCSNAQVAARLTSLLSLAKAAVSIFAIAAENPSASDADIQAAEDDANSKLSDLSSAADNATAGLKKSD